MNSQALADRLAELAGWRWDKNEKIWKHDRLGNAFYHGIDVGSLDALERWRGENLLGEWRWGKIDFWGTVDAMLCYGNPMAMGSKYRVLRGRGPDEWTARAAALIAAKESKNV